MRILMLVPYPSVRGPIPSIGRTLAVALRAHGCYVDCELWGRHFDSESFAAKVIGRAHDMVQIHRRLQAQTFDLMILHTAHDWVALTRDLPLLFRTRRLRPRTVLHLHGSLADQLVSRGHRLIKVSSAGLVRLCDALFVLSSEEAHHWQDFHPAAKIYLVKNPFDAASWPVPTAGRPQWVPPSDRMIILFVGRLIRQKGVFDLLHAMRALVDDVNCHLLVVGSGTEAPGLFAQCQALELADRVTFAGYLEGAELSLAYSLANVFAFPSWWSEGFATVISEAMNVGLPIVATCHRGVADHLTSGRHAIFVPAQDPRGLAEGLRRVLTDGRLRRSMSEANHRKVQEFSPELVASEYLSVLRDVANTS